MSSLSLPLLSLSFLSFRGLAKQTSLQRCRRPLLIFLLFRLASLPFLLASNSWWLGELGGHTGSANLAGLFRSLNMPALQTAQVFCHHPTTFDIYFASFRRQFNDDRGDRNRLQNLSRGKSTENPPVPRTIRATGLPLPSYLTSEVFIPSP